MSLSLGIFDVFTYTIPGSLYLGVVIFVVSKLGWADVGQLKSVPTLILVGGALITSYIAGFVADPLAEMLDRRLRISKAIYSTDVRESFINRVPSARHRPYVQADLHLLHAMAETNATDAASEISRLRATGLMLRNCSVPFLAACITSAVEAADGDHILEATLSSVVFAAAALSGIRQGKCLRIWANLKTLEICYWIPGIDEMAQGSSVIPSRSNARPRWRYMLGGHR